MTVNIMCTYSFYNTVRPIPNGTNFHEICSVIGYRSQGWAVIGNTAKFCTIWDGADCMTINYNIYV